MNMNEKFEELKSKAKEFAKIENSMSKAEKKQVHGEESYKHNLLALSIFDHLPDQEKKEKLEEYKKSPTSDLTKSYKYLAENIAKGTERIFKGQCADGVSKVIEQFSETISETLGAVSEVVKSKREDAKSNMESKEPDYKELCDILTEVAIAGVPLMLHNGMQKEEKDTVDAFAGMKMAAHFGVAACEREGFKKSRKKLDIWKEKYLDTSGGRNFLMEQAQEKIEEAVISLTMNHALGYLNVNKNVIDELDVNKMPKDLQQGVKDAAQSDKNEWEKNLDDTQKEKEKIKSEHNKEAETSGGGGGGGGNNKINFKNWRALFKLYQQCCEIVNLMLAGIPKGSWCLKFVSGLEEKKEEKPQQEAPDTLVDVRAAMEDFNFSTAISYMDAEFCKRQNGELGPEVEKYKKNIAEIFQNKKNVPLEQQWKAFTDDARTAEKNSHPFADRPYDEKLWNVISGFIDEEKTEQNIKMLANTCNLGVDKAGETVAKVKTAWDNYKSSQDDKEKEIWKKKTEDMLVGIGTAQMQLHGKEIPKEYLPKKTLLREDMHLGRMI